MSNKKIIFLSIILALVSALTVFYYLSNVNRVSANVSYQKVVVAKQDIPSKTMITKSMLQMKEVPKEYVNTGAYYSISDVVGKITKYEVISGEQILKPKIAGEKEISQGMSYAVVKGKRAITVSVNQVTGLNGFIKTGDRVDIGVTMDVELRGQQQSTKVTVNKTIVQNVEVLAVDSVVDSDAAKNKKDGKETELKTVTLLVPTEETGKIMLANDKGTLHLILRNPSDDEKTASEPLTPDKFLLP